MSPHKILHKLLLDNLNTAVLMLDADLRVSYINSAAEALLEISDQRIHGEPLSELYSDEDIGPQDYERVLRENRPYTKREACLRTHSGQAIVVDYSLTPIEADAAYILIELSPRDRLLRITREGEILAKQQAAQQLVRGLAHEIKNPLGGIRGAAQLLARELPEAPVNEAGLQEFTDIIIQETDRLTKLLDGMLGPIVQPKLEALNIHLVLERVCQLLRAETQGQLHIERDYDPSIPDIEGDKEQLMQALLNIARNAMQALLSQGSFENAQLLLRTRTQRQFTIGNQRHRLVARIDIIDNGPGIPSHLQDNIFYPTVSGRAEGSGLGLSIAQAILSRHQGLIECESEAGSTRFTLFIPIHCAGHQG